MDIKESQSDYYKHSRPEMLPFVPESAGRILEFGCSGGDFGALVKSRKDCVYHGVEPHEPSAREAEKKLDKVFNCSAEDFFQMPGNQPGFYDVVVFNDVLEHLADPYQLLNQVRPLLNQESGAVMASIPNFLYFYNILEILRTSDFKYREAGIMDRTHLRFFTKKSMVRMFEDCGYKIKSIQGINTPNKQNKFRLLNTFFFGKLKDWEFIQYALLAQVSQ